MNELSIICKNGHLVEQGIARIDADIGKIVVWCPRCQEWQPLLRTRDFFPREETTPTRLLVICRCGDFIRDSEIAKVNLGTAEITVFCSECREYQQLLLGKARTRHEAQSQASPVQIDARSQKPARASDISQSENKQ